MIIRTTRHAWLLILLVTFLTLPNLVLADGFTIVTNDLPPLKYVENGKLAGVAGDLLAILMERTDQHIDSDHVDVMPFSKAFETVKTRPGTILPCVARTPQRESDLKWVGPIYQTRFGFIAEKSRSIRIETLDDAKKLTLSTVKDSAPDKLSLQRGFSPENMRREATAVEAIRLLDQQEVDLFAFPQSPAYHVMLREGIDPKKYEMVFEFQVVELYIGFNNNTDDVLIEQFQTTLDAMKKLNADGKSEYGEIVSKYFAPWL